MISADKQIRERLSGQVAVVTGGGRGIGRAIAVALAESGVRTAAIARSERELSETVALIEENGGQAKAFVADVTDAARIRAVLAEIAETLGPHHPAREQCRYRGADRPVPSRRLNRVVAHRRGEFARNCDLFAGCVAGYDFGRRRKNYQHSN